MSQPIPQESHNTNNATLEHANHQQLKQSQQESIEMRIEQRDYQESYENSDDKNNSMKIKRYDYLNKYNQHDLMVKFNDVFNSRQDRITKYQLNRDQPSLQGKRRQAVSSNAGSIRIVSTMQNKALSKPKSQSRSSSKTSSRPNSRPKIKHPHYMYMKAYENNIPTFAFDPFEQQSLRQTKLIERERQRSQDDSEVNRLLNRIPNFSNGLLSQVQHQNQIYKGQVIQYKTLVNKLQTQLTHAREQARIADQNYRKQILCYQVIVRELKQEIIQLRNFNITNHQQKMRENVLRSNFQDKQNISTQNIRQENSTINLNRSLQKGTIKKIQSKSIQKFTNLQKYILERIQMIFNCCENKPSSLSSIKISNSFEEVLIRIQKLVQQNKKYESLIFNIKQMQRKIQKDREILHCLEIKGGDPTTRQLWKWLKMLGSSYSFMQQIKPLLGKRIGLDQQQSKHKHLKEIVQKLLIST